jgi:hypothetical protein
MEGLNKRDDHDGSSNAFIDMGKIKKQANIFGGAIGVGRP